MEKQIDSSSSTTNNFLRPRSSFSLVAFLVRPRKSSRNRPDTVFNINMELVGGVSSLLTSCRLITSTSCDVFVGPLQPLPALFLATAWLPVQGLPFQSQPQTQSDFRLMAPHGSRSARHCCWPQTSRWRKKIRP